MSSAKKETISLNETKNIYSSLELKISKLYLFPNKVRTITLSGSNVRIVNLNAQNVQTLF